MGVHPSKGLLESLENTWYDFSDTFPKVVHFFHQPFNRQLYQHRLLPSELHFRMSGGPPSWDGGRVWGVIEHCTDWLLTREQVAWGIAEPRRPHLSPPHHLRHCTPTIVPCFYDTRGPLSGQLGGCNPPKGGPRGVPWTYVDSPLSPMVYVPMWLVLVPPVLKLHLMLCSFDASHPLVLARVPDVPILSQPPPSFS